MELFETLFALGATPFVEVVAGFTFVLLALAAGVGVAFEVHDAAIARDIHRFVHEPRPGTGPKGGPTPGRRGFTPRLVDATT